MALLVGEVMSLSPVSSSVPVLSWKLGVLEIQLDKKLTANRNLYET